MCHKTAILNMLLCPNFLKFFGADGSGSTGYNDPKKFSEAQDQFTNHIPGGIEESLQLDLN